MSDTTETVVGARRNPAVQVPTEGPSSNSDRDAMLDDFEALLAEAERITKCPASSEPQPQTASA